MKNSPPCVAVFCFCPTFAHHSTTTTKILFRDTLTPCPLTKIMHVAVEICRQLTETYNILWREGGESLDFWNRGANNVLIWLGDQNFLWYEISRSQRCHLQVLKFGVGEIFWGLTFLAYFSPIHFLSIKAFS